MAYQKSIDEEAIYLSSGNPLPTDVDAMIHALLHDTFKDAFNSIWKTSVLKGYSLSDVLNDVMTVVSAVDFPNEVLGHIYSSLADIEYHLASGANERLQLGGVVGAFAYARAMMVE
ncbi:hypothetical protein VYU27_009933 [Nannochloropsis oceanica]